MQECNIPFKNFFDSKEIQSRISNCPELRETISNTDNVVIPSVKFITLFLQHFTAPFFLFQIFCCCLWLLDNYWYYSFLTLVMLVLFEISLIYKRINYIENIRKSRFEGKCYLYDLYCYRTWDNDNNWNKYSCSKIKTFDYVSLNTNANILKDSLINKFAPCDLLLLEGNVLVSEALLTGESAPVSKVGLLHNNNNDFDIERNKNSIIFGGTKFLLLQHNREVNNNKILIKKPPNNGIICVALRTGPETTQGSLIKSMISSYYFKNLNNKNEKESLYLILVLIGIALISVAFVLYNTFYNNPVKEEDINYFELFLHITLILTSVVPPELPMELSISVTNSLVWLQKKKIFCLDPSKLPLAGFIDYCCFDKTGTLTNDKLISLNSIVTELSDQPFQIFPSNNDKFSVKNIPLHTLLVMSGCHSLINFKTQSNSGIIGDPSEIALLRAINYTLTPTTPDKVNNPDSNSTYCYPTNYYNSNLKVKILKQFQFTSELKRMSAIIEVDNNYYSVCKGAPEAMLSLYSNSNNSFPIFTYNQLYQKYSSDGYRVIAMGIKKLFSSSSDHNIKKLFQDMSYIESDLEFAGFLLLTTPIKEDCYEVCTQLINSGHKLKLLTGDSLLTGIQVASKLEMYSKPLLSLTVRNNKYFWENKAASIPFDPDNFSQISKEYDFALSGYDLNGLINDFSESKIKAIISYISVFGRVSPFEKQFIMKSLNDRGYSTMMCGDGTNDVGALKSADVGIALVESEYDTEEKKVDMKKTPKSKNSLASNLGDEIEVQMGDATIAAPFTSRQPTGSLQCIIDVIRQGRCSLVKTMVIYKILALNCLISAFSLSVLYFDNIKFSDSQATLQGLLLAFLFFVFSQNNPNIHSNTPLTEKRPHSSIFSYYMIFSISLQFLTHLFFLLVAKFSTATNETSFVNPFSIDNTILNTNSTINSTNSTIDSALTSTFVASERNTFIFYISLAQSIFNFYINNYQTRHFFLNSNKKLKNLVFVCGFILIINILFPTEFLNEYFELIEFSSENNLKILLIISILSDFLLCTIFDRLMLTLFPFPTNNTEGSSSLKQISEKDVKKLN